MVIRVPDAQDVVNINALKIPAHRVVQIGADNAGLTSLHRTKLMPVDFADGAGREYGVSLSGIAGLSAGKAVTRGLVKIETNENSGTEIAAGDDLIILTSSGNEGKVVDGGGAALEEVIGRAVTAQFSETPVTDYGATSTRYYVYAVVDFSVTMDIASGTA